MRGETSHILATPFYVPNFRLADDPLGVASYSLSANTADERQRPLSFDFGAGSTERSSCPLAQSLESAAWGPSELTPSSRRLALGARVPGYIMVAYASRPDEGLCDRLFFTSTL